MASLVVFELKKMLTRRVAAAVNLGVLVFMAAIMTLNVVQTQTTDAQGNILSGPDAIAQVKENDNAHAGTLDPERVASDIASYQERLFERIDREAVGGMTGAAVYDLMFEAFDTEEVYELYNSYWSTLLAPWRIAGEEPAQTAARVTPEMAADWYGAVAQMTESNLDDGQGGTWAYSDAERSYWTDMQASVERPLSYGYVGGWSNIISCVAFLVFAILSICVTVAPVFSFEYQSGADAVVLSTRYGRSKLVAAKVAAALLYATAYFAMAAAIVIGFSLVFFGPDGFWLSIQNISLSCPYALSAGQAALILVGLMYLACMGFTCLTLALSSRTRSTLSVFVADVVLAFLTGMVPSAGIGVLAHVLALFPLGFTSFGALFSAMNSYPVGPVVVDLVGMVVAVYIVLSVAMAPLAAASFRRHQVL